MQYPAVFVSITGVSVIEVGHMYQILLRLLWIMSNCALGSGKLLFGGHLGKSLHCVSYAQFLQQSLLN